MQNINEQTAEPTRLVAQVTGKLPEPKVRHYVGLPPELTGGEDHRELMEWPSYLVIEITPESVFLERFTDDGCFVGDTWHKTLDEAKKQTEYEFEGCLSPWKSVPEDVEDPVEFARQAW